MKNKKNLYRVVTFLKRDELDFLDEMAKDLFYQHGINIPRAKLLEELVQACEEMAQTNKKALEQKVIEMFKETEKNEKKYKKEKNNQTRGKR